MLSLIKDLYYLYRFIQKWGGGQGWKGRERAYRERQGRNRKGQGWARERKGMGNDRDWEDVGRV